MTKEFPNKKLLLKKKKKLKKLDMHWEFYGKVQ